MTHSLWLFPHLPPGGDPFPCSQMTLPPIPHSLWLFSWSAAGRGFFPLLTSSLTLTDGTTFYITSSLTFPNNSAPCGGEFHSSLFLPAGFFFPLIKVGNTDTTEGNFTHHSYHQREFFPSTRWLATLTFSNLAPEGRGSRDMGRGGGNFILEKSFTTPDLCLTHYYCQLILILILSAVFKRRSLYFSSLQMSHLILLLIQSACLSDRVLFALHYSWVSLYW